MSCGFWDYIVGTQLLAHWVQLPHIRSPNPSSALTSPTPLLAPLLKTTSLAVQVEDFMSVDRPYTLAVDIAGAQ